MKIWPNSRSVIYIIHRNRLPSQIHGPLAITMGINFCIKTFVTQCQIHGITWSSRPNTRFACNFIKEQIHDPLCTFMDKCMSLPVSNNWVLWIFIFYVYKLHVQLCNIIASTYIYLPLNWANAKTNLSCLIQNNLILMTSKTQCNN